jgi:hypothetical protein
MSRGWLGIAVAAGVMLAVAMLACGGSSCPKDPQPYTVFVQGGYPPGTFDGGPDGGASLASQSWCAAECPTQGPGGISCFDEPEGGSTALQCAPIGAPGCEE